MSTELLIFAATAAVLVVGLVGWTLLVRSVEEQRYLSRRTREPGDQARGIVLVQQLERFVRRTRPGQAVAQHLDTAGLSMRTVDFVLINVVVFIIAQFVVDRFLSAILAIPIAIGVVAGIWVWVRHQRKKQLEKFVNQLPEVARLLSSGAGSGLGLMSSLELAAKELDDPAGKEMARLVQEIQIGQSLEGALANLAERVPSREIGVLVSTLVIQQRSGGNTVDSLRGMAETLEKRKELNREVQTLISESLFTAYAVAAMGVLLLVILNALYPGVLDDMLRSPAGILVLGVAGALYAMGFWVIRRLSRLEA